jgi:hypothetical protein
MDTLGGVEGRYRRGLVVEVDLPTRDEKILRLFRSTRAYKRMSTEKRCSTLLAAHFWAGDGHRGFW